MTQKDCAYYTALVCMGGAFVEFKMYGAGMICVLLAIGLLVDVVFKRSSDG